MSSIRRTAMSMSGPSIARPRICQTEPLPTFEHADTFGGSGRMNRFVFALWSLLGVIPLAAPPQYTDYPVTKIFRGTHAAPVLSSQHARMFRTQLRNAVKYGPNFAGHYTLARWGCGGGCVTVAVMDAISGQVWFAPFEIEDAKTENGHSSYGSEFEIDSELFVASGKINERVGIHYFRWRQAKFSLVHFEPQCSN